MNIRLAGLIHGTKVNGPGVRSAVWVQGCTLACSGCCNVPTWNPDEGTEWDVDDLASKISVEAAEDTEGITISGGEPFQQSRQVLELIKAVKAYEPDWSVFIFTGYDLKELEALGASAPLLLNAADIVVAGRFKRQFRCHAKWRSSSNQKIHFITDRYKREVEIPPATIPFLDMEFHINDDGMVTKTGFAGQEFRL